MSYNISSSPIDHYKKTVAISFLDSLIINSCPNARSIFDEDRHARKALQLDDEVSMLFWKKDNPFPKSLGNEVLRWKTLWLSKDRELRNNFLLVLGAWDEDAFPNIYRLLAMACTLPITSAEPERSFSLTCSRSTMPEERFSDLAVIATHYSERFEVEAHPRRLFQASLFD